MFLLTEAIPVANEIHNVLPLLIKGSCFTHLPENSTWLNGVTGLCSTLPADIFTIKKTRYINEQNSFALKQFETGIRVWDVCKKMDILKLLFITERRNLPVLE